MNILFVHEVDWLRKVVYEIHCLSEFLSLSGHSVTAIDYGNTWSGNKHLGFGSLRTREVSGIARAYAGASVCLRRPGFFRIPGLSRFFAAFTHYLEIQKTIKEKNIDAIVLYSVPTNGLQTVHLAKKCRTPVVFRSIDILNQLVPYPALRPMTRFLERKVYSSVDLILTLTPRLSQYVIDMGAMESRVRILPEGVDTDLFYPDISNSDSEIRRRFNIGERDIVILFVGTLFEFSGLDILIRQFPKVIEQIPEAKLLIVGDGPQRPRLEKIIAQLSLTNKVIITGFQPYETLGQYVNLATVCVNPFLSTKATMDVIPAKVLQYLACGKPVIATSLPGMKEILPSERQGVLYTDDPNDMARQLVSLLKSPERRQLLGEAGLTHIRQAHGYSKIAWELEGILKDLVKEEARDTAI